MTTWLHLLAFYQPFDASSSYWPIKSAPSPGSPPLHQRPPLLFRLHLRDRVESSRQYRNAASPFHSHSSSRRPSIHCQSSVPPSSLSFTFAFAIIALRSSSYAVALADDDHASTSEQCRKFTCTGLDKVAVCDLRGCVILLSRPV